MKFALQVDSDKLRGWLGLNGDNVTLFDSLADAKEVAAIISGASNQNIKPVLVPQEIVERILQDNEDGITHADGIIMTQTNKLSAEDKAKLLGD
jgi:hypothetical protein